MLTGATYRNLFESIHTILLDGAGPFPNLGQVHYHSPGNNNMDPQEKVRVLCKAAPQALIVCRGFDLERMSGTSNLEQAKISIFWACRAQGEQNLFDEGPSWGAFGIHAFLQANLVDDEPPSLWQDGWHNVQHESDDLIEIAQSDVIVGEFRFRVSRNNTLIRV